MGAEVTISTVVLGTGETHRWRGVKSSAPTGYTETAVQIGYRISNVPGDSDTAFQTITDAFLRLVASGRITSYTLGVMGSMPTAFYQPSDVAKGIQTVREIRKSRRLDNDFVVKLAEELRRLLDEISNAKKKR